MISCGLADDVWEDPAQGIVREGIGETLGKDH